MVEDKLSQLMLENQNLLKEKIKWLEEKVKLLEQIIQLKDKPAKIEYIPYYPHYPTYPYYPWYPTVTWNGFKEVPAPIITCKDSTTITTPPGVITTTDATDWIPNYTTSITMSKPQQDSISVYADTGNICDTSNTTNSKSTIISDIKFQPTFSYKFDYKKEQEKEMYRDLNRRFGIFNG